MDKCEHCGREKKPWSSRASDHCHYVGALGKKLPGIRSSYCYDAQIAALKSQLGERDELIARLQTEIRERSGYVDTIY